MPHRSAAIKAKDAAHDARRPPSIEEPTSRSERFDLHLAKFHHALTVLQRDRAGCILTILDVYRLHAVKRQRELWPLCDDLVSVPLASSLQHDGVFGHTRNGSGAIGRVGPGIVNVGFIGGLAADFLRI